MNEGAGERLPDDVQGEDKFVFNHVDPDEEIKRKIENAFALFDRDGKGIVVKEEVGTIMRYLGSYPSEEQIISEILPRIREDEDSHFVKYNRFETVMIGVLRDKDYEPDNEDIVLQAFHVIDHEKKGHVSDYRISQLLSSNEWKFRQKELESFLKEATDEDSERIHYDDYVKLMSKQLEQFKKLAL